MYRRNNDLPEACVMIFYASVIKKLQDEGLLKKVCTLAGYGVTILPLIYSSQYAVRQCFGCFSRYRRSYRLRDFEELIALGCRKFVACGSGGVLKSDLKRGMW